MANSNSLVKTEKEKLLKIFAEKQDIPDLNEDVKENLTKMYMFEDTVPGICMSCNEISDIIEPDSTNGWCEFCSENTVISILELLI